MKRNTICGTCLRFWIWWAGQLWHAPLSAAGLVVAFPDCASAPVARVAAGAVGSVAAVSQRRLVALATSAVPGFAAARVVGAPDPADFEAAQLVADVSASS